jgi:ribosome biogenesis GTPase
MNHLEEYGWNQDWERKWSEQDPNPESLPARVVADHGHILSVSSFGDVVSLPEKPQDKIDILRPKIGDWVEVKAGSQGESGVVRSVLPRETELARRSAKLYAGKQVMAANVDTAFVVRSAREKLDMKRLSVFILQIQASGIEPCVVVNKIDQSETWEDQQSKIKERFKDVGVVAISALENYNIDEIVSRIPQAKTAVLLGSSGAGKSTLLNALLGEQAQKTQPVRGRDQEGRHTTTQRKMFILNNGGLVIDSPGIKEISPWVTSAQLSQSNERIAEAAKHCRYVNCSHEENQDECGVLDALDQGKIGLEEWETYRELKTKVDEVERKLERRRKDI